MYAYTVIAFLAASAAAAAKGPSINSLTVQQAANSCANGQSVYCCNKTTNKPAGNSVGDGAGIANGLSLFSQCSKVDVNVIAIANNLLNKECQANAACCQDSPGTAAAGLINAALPCVAISNLV
ncbi:fungal hydrophobin domain-containing protein [Fusarium napiforme]|uniref:Hydrophobin n=1 Tax=Fusarium napiforme TaxID=42672 RepID=A0A8H5N751_9HYPO|nr:fungal hydrophobin domain-containing protein [Fusarium napiforme]